MAFDLFSRYSRTTDNAKNDDLLSFRVKLSLPRVMKIVEDYFVCQRYEIVKNKKEFNEIYAAQGKYETTVHFVPDGQIVRIVVAVYTHNNIGIAKKRVKLINSALKNLFSQYIV